MKEWTLATSSGEFKQKMHMNPLLHLPSLMDFHTNIMYIPTLYIQCHKTKAGKQASC